MKLAYVGGPYRGQVAVNIQRARYVAMKLWKMGFAVICPHANSGWMDTDGGIDNEVFLRGDLEILSRCDAIVCFEGWQYSDGTLGEIDLAHKLSIPVLFWPEDKDALRKLSRRAAQ